jgi:diadenylate cyclase
MKNQKTIIIENAINMAWQTGSDKIFLFLNSRQECLWFAKSRFGFEKEIVIVIPKEVKLEESWFQNLCCAAIRSSSGNLSRFSRIKYAFLQGVLSKIITAKSKIVCVLGAYDKSHLDTITVHDLGLSWSEDFPFDVDKIIKHKAFYTIMAVIDISLDIGALGREGKSVGTIFVIGDKDNVMASSHQAVFNPFRGYPKRERMIVSADVVESLKELAKIDGATVISSDGVVEAAGRHLDAGGVLSKKLRGLGARHRAAAGITKKTDAVAVVVSESTGKVTVFEKGNVIAELVPLISRRVV